jgi:demethylmenaquinone methyltransferase/2-methoxy-6-polyprenyl-1,4-benzoquinol methylase
MFGEIAPRYDFLNHLLSLGIDLHWRRQTVRRVPPEGAEPVLDLCAGTGDLALAYFRHGGTDSPIVAADFCGEMLAIGRQKGQRAGANGRLTFVEADAQQLPFPDDSFQIVSVAFGLRNVADPSRALAEMVRVCRPGGRVAVLEFSLPRRQPLRGVYRWYFRHVLPRIGALFARGSDGAYNYLPNSVGEFASGQALCDLMAGAGLGEVQFKPLTFGVATLYVGRKGLGDTD